MPIKQTCAHNFFTTQKYNILVGDGLDSLDQAMARKDAKFQPTTMKTSIWDFMQSYLQSMNDTLQG